MLDPVARDKISDLLPARKASFEELRSANAKLRASDAYLKESNSKSITVLVAADVSEPWWTSPGRPGDADVPQTPSRRILY